MLYRARIDHKDLEGLLIPLQIQYIDYAEKQQKQLIGTVLEKKLSYWKQRLNGIETLALPTTYNRPPTPSYKGNRINFEIDKILVGRLEHLCQSNGATLFMGLLATLSVLLKRYSNQDNITIGTPVANRNHAEIEHLIGFFVNTIVLRQDLQGNPTFIELLNRVKENTINDFKHQDAPLEKVIDALNLKRDESRSPLFQVMMVLQNDWGGNVKLPGMSMDMQLLTNETTKFDLNIELNKKNGSINGTIEYAVDLFDRNFIVNMIQHFLTMVDRLVTDPLSKIDQVNYLKPEESKQLLDKFNNTKLEYHKDKCVHELFAEHVKKTPNKTALIFENNILTYQELDQKSTMLAIHLQSLGVKPDDLIGICTERSLEMIVGILGVLKSGGAFVPLDPENPEDRLEYMLSDSKVNILLTQNKLKHRIKNLRKDRIKVLFLDRDLEKIESLNSNNIKLREDVRSNNLAYVIYTSGSTGRPKGVMIERRGVINYIKDLTRGFNKIDHGNEWNFSFFGNISFDGTLTTFLVPIASGGTCTLSSNQKEIKHILLQAFKDSKVNAIKLTPAHLQLILESDMEVNGKKTLVVGGEALKTDVAVKLYQKNPNKITYLINEYGPTECTIACSTYVYNPTLKYLTEELYIGTPMSNTQIHILDAQNNLVPIGIPGELHIAGAGVARGYFNQLELTKKKFIPNPFATEEDIKDGINQTLYKTGDLAKWLPDGNIEYLGRIDTQVKIRGFRIELGEIESVLNQYPEIKDSVVVVQGTQENKQLIGFYLPNDASVVELDGEKLRSFLKEKLPDYMIPSGFVALSQIPLTPNGKVDRKLLEQKDVALASAQQYLAPRNETEKALVNLFAAVLNVKEDQKIGIRDNFFELGGNSLLSIKMVDKINHLMDVNISIAEFFRFPTPALMSQLIDEQQKKSVKQISAQQLQNILKVEAAQTTKIVFPELFHLNKITQGHPIFWIHAGLGGIYPYTGVAEKLHRPFYSIQARGYQTKYMPLQGMQAMASYYVQIIQSIQPKGPYDLGGYSLGGSLAYEVTRQLQVLEEQVSTLVMIDSMDTIGLKKVNISFKSSLLQNANTSLLPLMLQYPDKIIPIDRNECDFSLEEDAYLAQLVDRLKNRGLQKDPSDLKKMVLVSESYDINRFSILPLTHPNGVQCYYFRNVSERLFGKLSPYFCISEEENNADHTEYWKEWECNLPNFTKIDAESSNHMVMLDEPQSAKVIIECCREIYSNGKIPYY